MSLKKSLQELKNDQIAKLNSKGQIIEFATVGQYELILYLEDGLHGVGYTVGIQRKGYDFTDQEDITMTIPNPNLSIQDLRGVVNKLKEWLKEYEVLLIGSLSEKKNQIYKRVFSKLGFNIKKFKVRDYTFMKLVKE